MPIPMPAGVTDSSRTLVVAGLFPPNSALLRHTDVGHADPRRIVNSCPWTCAGTGPVSRGGCPGASNIGDVRRKFRLVRSWPLFSSRCSRPHRVGRKDWSVTEIPEHLLKRSRDRRAGAASGDSSTPASSAPVPASPAAPAPRAAAPAPDVPKVQPDAPYVAAAKSRGRIPSWAMLTLALLPLFLFMYIRGLQPQKAERSESTRLNSSHEWISRMPSSA